MQIFNLNIPIYAESESEVAELRQSIVTFINLHRTNGRIVSAKKVSEALKGWDSNFIVKNKIIDYFE